MNVPDNCVSSCAGEGGEPLDGSSHHEWSGINQLLMPQKPGFQGLMVPPMLGWEETLPCACPAGAHMVVEGCRWMGKDADGWGRMQRDVEMAGAGDPAGPGAAPSPRSEAAAHHAGGPCFSPDILRANENIFAICIN